LPRGLATEGVPACTARRSDFGVHSIRTRETIMSELRLIRHCAEFLEQSKISMVPAKTRGIYALLLKRPHKAGLIKFDVVYIGMSRSGVRSRLSSHKRSPKKSGLWTHFSVYSVWPNITDSEIEELEGLFRAIYRKDSTANRIAKQKGFKNLKSVRKDSFEWQ
jgi:hypothetical protein